MIMMPQTRLDADAAEHTQSERHRNTSSLVSRRDDDSMTALLRSYVRAIFDSRLTHS